MWAWIDPAKESWRPTLGQSSPPRLRALHDLARPELVVDSAWTNVAKLVFPWGFLSRRTRGLKKNPGEPRAPEARRFSLESGSEAVRAG